jgi:hypothetical protein
MRSTIVAAVLAISTLFAAAPAMAGEHGKGGASFPMPAAAFQQKVTAREAKAREHMEKRAATLSADEAKALRAKFDANVAKVNAEVAKATADGTVTKDEAKAVRQVAKELRGHHGKGGKHAHKKK